MHENKVICVMWSKNWKILVQWGVFKAGFVIVHMAYEKEFLDIQYINVLGVTYFDEVYDTKFGLPFIIVEIHLYIQF